MTRYDDNWLRSLLATKPGYSLPADPVATGICHPQPKQDAQLLPLGEDKDEERGAGRFRVRITRYGAKLLDADNAAGAISAIPTQAEVENIRDAVLEIADVLGTLIADFQTAGALT